MAAKKPGFDNSVGNRNRRVNRYGNSGADNRVQRRLLEARGITIGFDTVPTPDEITDSASGLGDFNVDEVIQIEGSASNDGVDVVQTVAADALGVDDALTLEAAGADVIVKSRNNRREYRLA
jgi:hypothetical protein